jgi:hypothetical protein
VEQLRRRTAQAAFIRLLLAVADGIGLGLVGLAGLAAGQGAAAIQRWQWPVLLVGVPLAHFVCSAALSELLRRPYARHHAALFQRSHLLLWLLESELPAGYERVAHLLGGRQARAGIQAAPDAFERRLKAALLHWEALCRACEAQPYPPQLGWRLLPVLLATAWALAALAGQLAWGLHPLTPPVVFVLAAALYIGQQRSIGRDSFALELARALGAQSS